MTRPLQAGATLLEVLISMLVIGIVATGIMTAFTFGRQVTWRSRTELGATRMVEEVAETLRSAVNGDIPAGQAFAGLTLQPGIYVDGSMRNPPTGFVRLTSLGFPGSPTDPEAFARFQTNAGTAATMAGHGDGRMVVVEEPVDTNSNGRIDPPEAAAADLDGDGQTGLDLNDDGQADLRRVRVRVKFTSPSS